MVLECVYMCYVKSKQLTVGAFSLVTKYNTGQGSAIDPITIDGGTIDVLKLTEFVESVLDEHSAQEMIRIDLDGKSSLADYMIVASGRSNRHVNALADYVQKGLKEFGLTKMGVEGTENNDWVLIDAGDLIIHIFRPEVREFYNIEKIWTSPAGEGHLADKVAAKPVN